MRDDLLLYYERELTYLRQMGEEFAGKHPQVAASLLLEPSKCDDPHVERLLEAFAFLAARVHLKIDDDFPEITEALLGMVYPHFIRPIPSMSIVEFQVDLEQGKLTTGLNIPRNSMLYSRPVGGVPCKFQTCYDTTLLPLSVTAAEAKSPDRLKPAIQAGNAGYALRVELRSTPDAPLPKVGIDRLRFHLFGESSLTHILYELLCSKLIRIVVRDPSPLSKTPPVTLPASSLRPVGFAEEEGVLPYPRRSFIGYRLLAEYFTMPEKFLFVDLTGLETVWSAGFKNSVEFVFLLSGAGNEDRRQRLEIGVSPQTFRLGSTPVVNLFPQTAEPILLDQHKYEYQVVPDVRRAAATEVFSVDQVASTDGSTRQTVPYAPFYSYRHTAGKNSSECFWIANRRDANRLEDEGSDIYLSLVDRSMRPVFPDADTLTVRTTCTNRNLPARLPFGSENGDFELEGNAPLKRIVALRRPTQPLRPPQGKMALVAPDLAPVAQLPVPGR